MFGFKRLRLYAGKTFSVSQWMAKDSLVGGARNVRALYREIVHVSRGHRQETFQEAVVRLGLTERDIAQRIRHYRKTSLLYGVFWVASLMYCAMMYKAAQWLTFVASVAYSFLIFSYFFREHFWLVQIKKRKFGLGFLDWFKYLLVG